MADERKRYSESEIRGQITAAFALTEALKWMADAKVRAAGEEEGGT